MFKVKYYQHSGHYYENLVLNRTEIHITQSASLSQILRDKGSEYHVFGYMAFTKGIFSNWYHPHNEVYLKSRIRQYLRDHVQEDQWFYYRKWVEDYYLSIRFLIELGGLQLHDFPELNHKQRLLISMLKELSEDSVIREYLSARAGLTKGKVLQKLGIMDDVDTVYFHHFDYLDARRMMLFQLLKQIGFEVVFCIPYNSNYHDLYQAWETIYQQVTDGTTEEWEGVETSSPIYGSKLAHYLDKSYNLNEVDNDHISFLSFHHPTQFKEYLETHPMKKNQYDVIGIFEKDLNVYFNQDPHHHFYATPYGKFFLSLQKCKKTVDEIQLSYDDFVNMMVSGWVQSGNTNGSQALTLLIDLKDYMDGITDLNEILDRLQSLVQLQDFGSSFDELSKEQTERHPLKKYVSNPFRAFPYVHASRYQITVKQLIDCTKDLARKVNLLLPKEHTTRNVREYLHDLHKIYSSVKEKWDEAIAQKFEIIFNIEIPSTWEFAQDELFQFLSFYLASDDQQNGERIDNFDELVGKALTSEHIHITDLSLTAFPWNSPPLPPLLNHSWLKKCIYKSFISNNRNIRLNALLVDYYSRELTRKRSLYFLYHVIAFGKGNITFSFIEDLREKDGPSIYFTILKELYQNHSISSIPEEEDYDWGNELDLSQVEVPKEKYEMIPDLLWLDSDFCHKKFFLNAFVEHHPIYEKDFHQQLVFATIGKLLSEQGEGEQEVQNVLFPLFPQWTNAHKQNLVDLAFAKGLRTYKSFENIYYPKAMKRLQVLYSRYEVTKNWKAKYQYDHDTFKLDEHVKDFQASFIGNEIKAKAGHHCRMCPFLHLCEEGEYVIDANDN